MYPEKKPRDIIYAQLTFAPDGERDLRMRRTFSSSSPGSGAGTSINTQHRQRQPFTASDQSQRLNNRCRSRDFQYDQNP